MPVALVIEDEPELAAFAVAVFRRFGFEAFVAESVAFGLDMLDQNGSIATVLVNVAREADELALVREIAARAPATRIILLSARLGSLRELPPSIFLAKPTTASTIVAIIRRVARMAREEPEDGPRN